ncbi:MAG: hypothetical protein ACJA2M_000300 [Polaribacter sp.]|jgi:hypothetical protein
MKQNFKQREYLLDSMDCNINLRLSLYESIKYKSFKEKLLAFLNKWY